MNSESSLQPLLESSTECEKPIQGEHAKNGWHRLLRAHSSRDRGATQNKRSKEAKLNAIGLAVLDAVPTIAIYVDVRIITLRVILSIKSLGNENLTKSSNSSARDDRRQRAGLSKAEDTATSSQSRQDERRSLVARLHCLSVIVLLGNLDTLRTMVREFESVSLVFKGN